MRELLKRMGVGVGCWLCVLIGALLVLAGASARQPEPAGAGGAGRGGAGGESASAAVAAEVVLDGVWRVSYTDAVLGEVRGEATFKPGEKDGEVVLKYARTARDVETTYRLKVERVVKDGGRVRMTLRGASPSGARVLASDTSGAAVLEVPAAVLGLNGAGVGEGVGPEREAGARPAEKVAARVKAEDYESSVPIVRKGVADLDVVEVEFRVDDRGDLRGEWSYTADAITERDRAGRGRVGTFRQVSDDPILGEQRGRESWTRKRPVIELAMPVVDQMHIGTLGPDWPWPFASWVDHPEFYARRRLIVIGKDLPGLGQPAVYRAGAEGFAYFTQSTFDDRSMGEYAREDLARGWKRAESLAAAAGKHLSRDEYQAMLVDASFDARCVPGVQTFSLNGAPAEWVLAFGDVQGDLYFGRVMSEDVAAGAPGSGQPAEAGEVERTETVFRPESVVLELRCDTTIASLASVEVKVAVGESGVKVGGRGTVTLTRAPVAQAPRKPWQRAEVVPSYYRSAPIRLVDAGRMPTNLKAGELTLACAPGDVLVATMADARGLDARKPAKAKVYTTPGNLGSLWKDALRRAATCRGIADQYDWGSLSGKEAQEIANICFADVTPRKGLSVLVNVFNPVSIDKLEPLRRRTAVTIADHAAMLVLREAVVPMLERQKRNLEALKTPELVYAWGASIAEACASGANPLGKLEVTKPARAGLKYGVHKISYALACMESFRRDMFPGDEAGARAYFIAATKEVLDQYREAAGKAYERAKNAGECDIPELLEITGTGFDAVVASVLPRLMKLEEQGSGEVLWVPDRPARAAVMGLARLAEAVKAQQDYAKLDTQFALLIAGGIASMPAIVSEGFAAAVISFALNAGLFGVDAGMAIYEQMKNDAEYEFALGSRGVLGDDRLSEALLSKTEWWQTVALLVAQGALTGLDGVGVILKGDLEAAKKAAPALLEKMRSADGALSGLHGLSAAEQRQLMTAISDAEQAALKRGLEGLTPEQRALWDMGGAIQDEARAARRAARAAEEGGLIAEGGTPGDGRPVEPGGAGGAGGADAPGGETATGPRGDAPVEPSPVREPVVSEGGGAGGPKPEGPGISESVPKPDVTEPSGGVVHGEPGAKPEGPGVKPGPDKPVPAEPVKPEPVRPGPAPEKPSASAGGAERPVRSDTPTTDVPAPEKPRPAPGPREDTGRAPVPPSPEKPVRPDTPTTEVPAPEKPSPTSTSPSPDQPAAPKPAGEPPVRADTPTTDVPGATKPEPVKTVPEKPSPTSTAPTPDKPVRPDTPTADVPAPEKPGPRPGPRDDAGGTPVPPERPSRGGDASAGGGGGGGGRRDTTVIDDGFDPGKTPVIDDGFPDRPVPDAGSVEIKPSAGSGASGPDTTIVNMDVPPTPTIEVPRPRNPPGPRPVAPAPPAVPTPAAHGAPVPASAPTAGGRTPRPIELPAQAQYVDGAPPLTGGFEADTVYMDLPARIDGSDAWKRGNFLYQDSEGRVWHVGECIGEGQFNRLYRLEGPGNEGLGIKFRMHDDAGLDEATLVREAKRASDDLDRIGVAQARVHQAFPDADVPYVVVDMVDQTKGQKLITRAQAEADLAKPESQRRVWTRAHQEAVVDLQIRLAQGKIAAEDLKIDNIFFVETPDGKVVAGVLDHDRIGRLDSEQMKVIRGFYDPQRVSGSAAQFEAKAKAARAEVIKAAKEGRMSELPALRAKADNLTKKAEQVRGNYGMESLNTFEPGQWKWKADDYEAWSAKMFEHNHYVRYNKITGEFEANLIDPQVLKDKGLDLYKYLGTKNRGLNGAGAPGAGWRVEWVRVEWRRAG